MNLAVARRRYDSPQITAVRSLTTADLAVLRTNRAAQTPIKTLRDRHHHIAWMIALGKPHTEIAVSCKISPSRISIHLNDPTFVELVNKYRAEVAQSRREHTDDFVGSATRTMIAAENEILRRLDTESGDLSVRDLNSIATDRMDRFGYAKHTTSDNRNINVNFAAKFEAAIARSRKIPV